MADDDWGAEAAAHFNQVNSKGPAGESERGEKPSAPLGRGMGRGAPLRTPGCPPAMGQEPEDPGKELSASEASAINKLLHRKLVTTKAEIEIQHKDPKSPLYSVKSFEALHLKADLMKGIYDMGFSFPSKIQESALPALLADPPSNMIAQSQSGTGKTAAFVCCILSRVDQDQPHPQCILLSPTYELALQTGDVIRKMARYMPDIKIRMAVRGERVTRGENLTEQIIVGTPGTILDWCIKFKVINMQKINVFVLDEADVMIDQQGHQDQSIRLQKQLRPDCQMLLFSATYTPEVIHFAENIISHPIVIRLRKEEESLDNIKQCYIECSSNDNKFEALCNIYGTISIGQSMIFCRTRRTAEWLCSAMIREGHAVALLSGDLDVGQRQSVIERFRDGKEKVLITTNVSSRGLDIEQVTVVVNFDLPTTPDNSEPDYETYLHRIGRTGRFGKSGLAINFVDGSRTMDLLLKIENHFRKKIELLDATNVNEIEKIKQ